MLRTDVLSEEISGWYQVVQPAFCWRKYRTSELASGRSNYRVLPSESQWSRAPNSLHYPIRRNKGIGPEAKLML